MEGAYFGGAPKKVDTGGPSIEEDYSIQHKADGVPECVEDRGLCDHAAHSPFCIGGPVQAKNHYCYHSTGASCREQALSLDKLVLLFIYKLNFYLALNQILN